VGRGEDVCSKFRRLRVTDLTLLPFKPRFNIYIYDYCMKRGLLKTAQELLIEADIPADAAPPINAKQGLLFEWVTHFFSVSSFSQAM
jgi:hypothetical protein